MPIRNTNPIAVCAFDLNSGSGLQLFPAGEFSAKDGRPFDVKAWYIDAALAQRIIEQMAALKNRIVIDYEHQTLNAAKNGQPAPASGWINPQSLEWREGEGLFATDFKWTPKAQGHIRDEEYAYLSPVFPYNKKTGEVTGLFHLGLVNDAGLDGMAEVVAAKFNTQSDYQENLMDEATKLKLIKQLGLADTATDQEVIAACKALQDKLAEQEEALAALKTQHGEEVEALKANVGNPDPAKFVPAEIVESLKTEVAALKTSVQNSEVDDLVSTGLKDGKLLPVQTAWAKDIAAKNGVAALKSYLDATPAIAALKGQQSAGRKDSDGKLILSDEQVAICKQLNVSPAEYINTLESN